MWRLFLLSCLIANGITQSHAKDNEDKSSSIFETESHKAKDSEDSGFSESGLDSSGPSARVTKARAKAFKRRPELRSSKFPLQFATRVTRDSGADDETEETVGKKIYKDVGYRKDKFEKVLLKEKRKASTKNPDKKKKTTILVKTKKPRRSFVFENASDLNIAADLTLFTMPNLAVTGIIDDNKEVQIDKSKAGNILKEVQDKWENRRGKKFTEDDESSIGQRSDNPIFKASNESGSFGSRYDDLLYSKDKDDKGSKDGGVSKVKKEKESRGKTTVTADSEEYDDDMDEDDYVFTTLTEIEKEERAYNLLSRLKNQSGIHVPSAERADHKKIIMDTLRRQGLSNSDEEILDIVSHYDSITQKSQEEKMFARTKPINLTNAGPTTKKSILYSIEQAYAKALRQTKNKNLTRHLKSEDSDESKEYHKPAVDVGYTKHSSASREKRREEKKARRKEKRGEREARKKGKGTKSSKEGSVEGAKESPDGKATMKPVKERPILKREERPRRDSRERYGRDRYDRDRPRYSRERYGRGRYDSPPRYGDRRRFDSRERFGRDRYSRERYRPRYDQREYKRRDSREDRGRGRDYRERGTDIEGVDKETDKDDRARGTDDRGRWRDDRGRGRDFRARGTDDRGRWRDDRGRGRDDRGGEDKGRWRNDRGRDNRRPASRERQTRKKWYSEEKVAPKRVYGDDTRRAAHNDDRYVRNAGRSRMNNRGPPIPSSFERDFSKIATNDENNSMFKKFIKNKKLSDIEGMEDVVTIP